MEVRVTVSPLPWLSQSGERDFTYRFDNPVSALSVSGGLLLMLQLGEHMGKEKLPYERFRETDLRSGIACDYFQDRKSVV